jgi:deazaflavin-dependent oxidoreductase (nitroreductase family)
MRLSNLAYIDTLHDEHMSKHHSNSHIYIYLDSCYTKISMLFVVECEDGMSDFNDWNASIISEFRANGGNVGGQFKGAPLLLLHTTGAKSGQARINPLAYTKDGEHFVVIASKGGAPTNPDWYYNILAHSTVTVEVGTEQFQARARSAAEPERTRIFEQMAAQMPGFAEYQRNTSRTIPVVVLERIT